MFEVIVKDESKSSKLSESLSDLRMGRMLRNLSESGRTSMLRSVLPSISSVLSVVDCSRAPLTRYESFHRSRCEVLEGTCGVCVEGYVGVSGSSNTPCFPLNIFINSFSKSELSQSTSSHLMLDGESVSKSCPNSCSGHGTCVYQSISITQPYHHQIRNTTLTLTECDVFDVDCISYCECDPGYRGLTCSPTEEYEAKSSLSF